MRNCAFLTLEDPTGFVIDDELAVGAFAEIGWRVETVPWTKPGGPWSRFDAVILRSTWDYQKDRDGFLGVLEDIERAGARLFNELELVRWNLDKTYLRELAAKEVPVVPTVWRPGLTADELDALFAEIGSAEMVLKPVLGANADGLVRLERGTDPGAALDYYARRPLLAQPFVGSVAAEGECSLFYFNGAFSHAISKLPKPGDIRSQEEHGGRIRPIAASDELLAAGIKAMSALPARPLYARVDLVWAPGGAGLWLMELELVEPALYFRTDAGSPRRFAAAFAERIGQEARAKAGAR